MQYAADAGTSAAGVEQPLRWKGHPRDAATGLMDMRARWWWAEGGVFVSVDEFAYHDARSTLWGWPGQNAMRYSDTSGHWGSYVWGSAEAGNPGPVRLGGEVVAVAGYDSEHASDHGFYVGSIGAVGGEVGGEANYAAGWYGVEDLSGASRESILLGEIGIGLEIPFLGGANPVGGFYRTYTSEWGLFLGAYAGLFGEGLAAGGGIRLPRSLGKAIDALFGLRPDSSCSKEK